MNIGDKVAVKTDGGVQRQGHILAIEHFYEGDMFLVALPEYPNGVWFFNESATPEGTFVELLPD
jgi:hypothetical protein